MNCEPVMEIPEKLEPSSSARYEANFVEDRLTGGGSERDVGQLGALETHLGELCVVERCTAQIGKR